jgi:hypothetical protein
MYCYSNAYWTAALKVTYICQVVDETTNHAATTISTKSNQHLFSQIFFLWIEGVLLLITPPQSCLLFHSFTMHQQKRVLEWELWTQPWCTVQNELSWRHTGMDGIYVDGLRWWDPIRIQHKWGSGIEEDEQCFRLWFLPLDVGWALYMVQW